jgi:DNA-binding response OmpR family regulator
MTKILIVDDEVETLNVLSTFLGIMGYHAITTFDSRYAMMLAENEKPDCVLLDVMMPDIDGFTLCKQMRNHPITQSLPIMFITAYSPLDLEDRRKEVGADMVLPKPFSLDSLTRSIESLISMRGNKIEVKAEAPPESAYTFRRDAKTGVFSAKLQDFLSKMDFNQ